jgi:hypothetical protein
MHVIVHEYVPLHSSVNTQRIFLSFDKCLHSFLQNNCSFPLGSDRQRVEICMVRLELAWENKLGMTSSSFFFWTVLAFILGHGLKARPWVLREGGIIPVISIKNWIAYHDQYNQAKHPKMDCLWNRPCRRWIQHSSSFQCNLPSSNRAA